MSQYVQEETEERRNEMTGNGMKCPCKSGSASRRFPTSSELNALEYRGGLTCAH